MLRDKKIILGVSGGIAVYKVADWVRELRRCGAEVKVIMTENAARFVSPLTFAALSGNKVYQGMFDTEDAENIPHINLAAETDLILLAPATAQTIARLSQGMADDLLATVILATKAPVIVCPAMNSNMYEHPATQANIDKLREFGYRIVDPESGNLACNKEGPGRLVDWLTVKEAVYESLTPKDLKGIKVMVTAGPTHEPLDPVRYLGNNSSGRMGVALAVTAKRRGAEVTLVTGPIDLPLPTGMNIVKVTTAEEMADSILDRAEEFGVIVKAAAVADFRPESYSPAKIKKSGAEPVVKLTANRDILKTLGEYKADKKISALLVGFAAESGNLIEEGQKKLQAKNLDLLAVNDITADDAGFKVDTNRIILLDKEGSEERCPLLSKEETSDLIWNRVVKILSE